MKFQSIFFVCEQCIKINVGRRGETLDDGGARLCWSTMETIAKMLGIIQWGVLSLSLLLSLLSLQPPD